jgi:uncharacterized protein YacL
VSKRERSGPGGPSPALRDASGGHAAAPTRPLPGPPPPARTATRGLVWTALAVAGGLIGVSAGGWLLDRGWLVGPNNLVYLTALGLLLGLLVGVRVGDRWGLVLERAWRRSLDLPPEAVLAAGTGATVGLLVTVLLNNVLAVVPGFTWYWSLLIAATLVMASSWFFVVNRRLFAVTSVARPAAPAVAETGTAKVIDTSAIIDGRLVDVAEANFLDGRLLVPQFVLAELQRVADAEDPLKRRRGRRGLEMLDRLIGQSRVPTEVVHDDPEGGAVDDKLVRVCLARRADLVTTDYNLHRVASLQGVRVLNLHQLANVVKAPYLPGERLSLTVARAGREPGQGLAYLEDGTMVVVEDAAQLVGRTVDAVVTSSLQTQMGRMIFARPADAEPRSGLLETTA